MITQVLHCPYCQGTEESLFRGERISWQSTLGTGTRVAQR